MLSVFKESIAHQKPANTTALHCSLPPNQPATFFQMFFVYNHKLPCSFNKQKCHEHDVT